MFFSTYTDKGVIISTPDQTKINTLKNIINSYHRENNKWVNKCTRFYDLDSSKIMKLSENKKGRMEDSDIYFPIEVSKIDVSDSKNLYGINRMHQLCNCDLFIMYNFEYTPRNTESILTLQGIHVTELQDYPIDENDFVEYFNILYNNDFMLDSDQ
jgi:hypothetical protein